MRLDSKLLSATVVALCLLLATSAFAAEGEDPNGVDVSLGADGLRFRTNDGRFKFQIGGRLHFDGATHPGNLPTDASGVGDADPTDGVEIRRGRIFFSATFYDDWTFVNDIDFADDDVAVKDLLLSYSGFDWARFTVGSQKQPYSEAVEMSSNDLPFVERGIDNDLIIPFIDRALGFRVDSNGDWWHVAGGAYGDNIDPTEVQDEGWGLAGRAVVAPILTENQVLHLGFRGAYRQPKEDDQNARIRTETTHFSNLYISNTGMFSTNSVSLYGPEFAYACGPFSIFGEYNRAHFQTGGGNPNVEFQSGHIGATWSLTGESRATTYTIESSEFKRLTPFENFSLTGNGWGAFELASRYAYIDVTDENIRGGQEGRLSTSLNWYLNPVVRFMFDWTRVMNAKNGSIITSTAKGLDILTGRVQIAF